jgi:hypothetical protein
LKRFIVGFRSRPKLIESVETEPVERSKIFVGDEIVQSLEVLQVTEKKPKGEPDPVHVVLRLGKDALSRGYVGVLRSVGSHPVSQDVYAVHLRVTHSLGEFIKSKLITASAKTIPP